jgi:hypothetical protein
MSLIKLSLIISLVAACSAHQRRIDTARHDGNEPLAACFETCKPDDDGCVRTCEQQNPARWHHKFSPAIAGAKQVAGTFVAALHPIAVLDARNGGNEPLAACFETCKPDDLTCMRTCDQAHARPIDQERRREMLALVAKIGVESYKREREQKDAWAASNGPSNMPGASVDSSTRSSSSPSSSSTDSAPSQSAPAGPPKDIHFGKSCNECDTNLKHGLGCTISAKATCGNGDMRSGSGFCVARPTDKKGSCSARCQAASDCPGGNTCTNLGTGLSVCVRS